MERDHTEACDVLEAHIVALRKEIEIAIRESGIKSDAVFFRKQKICRLEDAIDILSALSGAE
jgi:hypothetical protein